MRNVFTRVPEANLTRRAEHEFQSTDAPDHEEIIDWCRDQFGPATADTWWWYRETRAPKMRVGFHCGVAATAFRLRWC